MIIEIGNKVHVIYRALYESSNRRHFVGEITACEGVVARVEGYVFVMDVNSRMFLKKPERRVTIIDLAESGYIVNMVPQNVDVDAVEYRYLTNVGLVATDGQDFSLDINEFSMKH